MPFRSLPFRAPLSGALSNRDPSERLSAALRKQGSPGLQLWSRESLAGVDRGIRTQHGREPIPAAEFRTNEVPVDAERFAQRGDLNLEVFFRHDDARPHPA